MRYPTLKELPSPPLGKTGWPWAEESPQLPDTMPDGLLWPRISIVTPSLNQGQFIEETIRSVLLQGYPNLEYIIIDGGSTDGSVDIIKKYEKWLACWVSEPDNGQPQAINKGFRKITGHVVTWINSDDYYTAEALKSVGNIFITHPDVDMIYGDMLKIYEDGRGAKLVKAREFSHTIQIQSKFIPQPTCFWRPNLFKFIGYLDESYQYIFDVDYWIRAGFRAKIKYFPILLANFRIHSEAKTQQNNRHTAHEGIRMYEKLFSAPQISPDILKLKRKVLEHWYERLAKEYLRDGMYSQARQAFRQAILATPMRPQNITLFIYLLDTFFRANWGQKFQDLSLKIRTLLKQN